MGGDVFFLLHLVEKGEGENGNGRCTLGVQESVCRGVSVLEIGPSRSFGSRNEAWLSGRTKNVLASAYSANLDSDHKRPGRGWGLTPFSILAMIIR